MSEQTHNIHTFMEGWKKSVNSDFAFADMETMQELGDLVLAWAELAHLESTRVFTAEQCYKVIRSWPEYKAALERLGGGQ